MQYSLMVFEIVFYNLCNIMDGAYRGWVVERGGGGWLRGVGVVGVGGKPSEGRLSLSLDHRQ